MFWIWFLFYDISNAHILWDFVRNGSLLNFLFENLISKWYHKTSDLSSIFYRYTLLAIMYFRIYRTNKNIFKNHITQLKVIFFAGDSACFQSSGTILQKSGLPLRYELQKRMLLKIHIGKPDYIFDFWLVFPCNCVDFQHSEQRNSCAKPKYWNRFI